MFSPSANYKDYRLEFFGQVESKSMGWVVRAQDKQNYYAMKFTVIEPGLRPILALVTYPVVGGKPGHKLTTPLSAMVHNRQAYHVAVDVRGSRFTTSIEGEQVSSFTDSALAQGGMDLLDRARRDAFAIVAADAGLRQPEHAGLRAAVLRRYGQTLELAEVG